MKKTRFVVGMLLLASLVGCSTSKQYEKQNKVAELTQTGMLFYWNNGDFKKAEKEFFKGITLKGKFDVVENSFKEASELAPERLDLRFGIASSQIIQNKTNEAIENYKKIIKMYPESFDANMLLAGYTKVLGNNEEYDNIIEKMKKVYPEKTKEFVKRFERTEKVMGTKFETKAYKINNPNNVIVTLGYALGKDGVMQKPLIERLQQTLELAKLNPDMPIIVTGGVQKGGVTEGYVMKKWLVERGIDSNRIYIEDLAKDTVGNAFYSVKILKDLNAKNVTLITSASHMRRAIAILKEMSVTKGLQLDNITNLIYLDYDNLDEAYKISPKERLVIYRDMMRAADIWAYPGIQM